MDTNLPQVTVIQGKPIPLSGRQMTASEIVDTFKHILSEQDPDNPGRTYLESINRKLVEDAKEGDKAAITIIFDRVMGKPTQTTANLNVGATLSDFLKTLSGEEDTQREDPLT